MAKGGGGGRINIVLDADAEGLKKGLAEARAALSKTTDFSKKEQEKLARAAEELSKKAAGAGNVKQQQRALFNLAATYAKMGDAGSAAFREVTQQAINAKREIEDVQDAINAADLEGQFKTGAVAVGKLAQGVGGVQGAMMALGFESENAQLAMAKLQGIMALGQGLEAISSIDGEIVALAKNIKLAEAAQKALNFAMSPTGMGLIAAGVTLAVTAFVMLQKKVYEVNQALKIRNELAEDTSETLKSEYGASLALVAVLKDETQSRDTRNAALKKLQQEYPGYLSNVNLDKTTSAELRAEIDKLNNSLFAKAKLMAANKKLEDVASKEVETQIKLNQALEDEKRLRAATAGKDLSESQMAGMRSSMGVGAFGSAEQFRSELKLIETQKNELLSVIRETNSEIAKTEKGGATGTAKTGTTPKPKASTNAADIKAAADEYKNATWLPLRTEIQKVHDQNPIQIAEALDVNLTSDKLGRIQQMTADINSALTSGIQSLYGSTADAMAGLMEGIVSGADEPLKNFGRAMLETLAGFMSTLGKAIMAAAVASQKFQASLLASPGVALAAGAALVVAAGAVRGIMKRGVNNDQGGGGGRNTGAPEGITRFAQGGIVSGPTLGLMGEYPGARSNPEVIAPLNKLKAMLGEGGGGTLTTRVSGDDLIIVLDRAQRNKGRYR